MDLADIGLHGAYHRKQVVAAVGRRRLGLALRLGELRALWTGVVVEPRRLVDPWTRAAAAQLSIGPDMALAGSTAAFLHGCDTADAVATHVVVPYKSGARSRRGLVVHNATAWRNDVVDIAGLRVLALDRVLGDELCTARPRDALALTDQALRRANGDHDRLRSSVAERIRARADPRGTVRGAFLLDLASPRAESPPESWLRLMLVERGFPLPEVNWSVCSPSGRELYRIDLAWPQLRIAIEYDGYAVHAGRADEDADRQADLERRGWIVVRVRVADIADPARVERELHAAFAGRGYAW
ncbi:MAG: endonuclease domain-containing protein [Pseudonocardia sp.]